MRQTQLKTVLKVSALAVALLASLWLAVGYCAVRSLRHAHLRFSEADAEAAGTWVRQVVHGTRIIGEMGRAGKLPSRRIDYASIGSPENEKRLLELRKAIDLYEFRYGRLPKTTEELAQIRGVPPETAHAYSRLAGTCQILYLGPVSYLLNCDGWTAPATPELGALVKTFDPYSERFYRVDSHVLMFVPPHSIGAAEKVGR